MSHVLLVDDDPDIIQPLKRFLIDHGLRVSSADNGRNMRKILENSAIDIILLDVMMPEMDGIEACIEIKKINSLSNTRIIFLSARGEDFTQIAAFDAGADDYITKPVKPKILIKKISSISKRINDDDLSHVVDLGEIKIDKESYLVSINKEDISLPRKEFELLYLIASKPGKVFSRDEIMTKVWGTQVIVGDRTIDVHVRKLREKIGEKYIKTIKGVGYKFKLNVKKK